MNTVILYSFLECSFFIKTGISRLIDPDLDLTAEAIDMLSLENVKNPSSKEIVLAKKIALANYEKIDFIEERKGFEIEKDTIVRFGKQAICSGTIRHSLEMFTFTYNSDTQVRLQGEVHNILKKKLPPSIFFRFHDLRDIVIGLASHYRMLGKIEENENFAKLWNKLRNFEYGLATEEVMVSSKNSKLRNILHKLHTAENETIAKQYWSEEINFWRRMYNQFSEEEYDVIQDLCVIPDDKLPELKKQDFRMSSYIVYAKDIIKIGYVLSQDSNAQYKKCIWILYTCDERKIWKLMDKIKDKWPHLDRARRTHKFCWTYKSLYNAVSFDGENGPPGVAMAPPSCVPDSEDYRMYIGELYPEGSDDAYFLLKLLNPVVTQPRNLFKNTRENRQMNYVPPPPRGWVDQATGVGGGQNFARSNRGYGGGGVGGNYQQRHTFKLRNPNYDQGRGGHSNGPPYTRARLNVVRSYTYGRPQPPPPGQNRKTVRCACGFLAKKFVVKKDTVNKGREFYSCPKMQDDPERCNFFLWA